MTVDVGGADRPVDIEFTPDSPRNVCFPELWLMTSPVCIGRLLSNIEAERKEVFRIDFNLHDLDLHGLYAVRIG